MTGDLPPLYVGAYGPLAAHHHALTGSVDLYQYSTAIVEAKHLFNEITHENQVYTWAFQRLDARLGELTKWVADGHTLVVILDQVWSAAVVSNDIAETVSLTSCSPFSFISFENVSGDQIEFCGPQPYAKFFEGNLKSLQYTQVIRSDQLTALLRVRRSTAGLERAVGGFLKVGKGTVYFFPKITDPEFLKRLASIATCEAEPAELPPTWLDKMHTAEEMQIRSEIWDLEGQAASIATRIGAKRAELQALGSIKALITATDNQFENAVSEALTELGLKVIEGPKSRADLLATDGKRILAIEAKGLEGSVRENNLTQANRWLAELSTAIVATPDERKNDIELHRYFEKITQLGLTPERVDVTDCKALVCVATYRKAPPWKRQEPDFPDNVLKCPSSGNSRLIKRFSKGGSGSSGVRV